MRYEEFRNYVAENIADYLPEEFAGSDIEVKEMEKPNVTLYGLIVRRPGSNISPNVYLENFFERYEKNIRMSDIMESIAKTVVEHSPSEDFSMGDMFEKENVLKTVLPKLISLKRNEKYLEDKVYTKFLDMAVVYQVPIENIADSGFACVVLTKRHADTIGITVEELFNAAKENIKGDYIFESMAAVLFGMVGEEIPDDCGMMILTNKAKMNGAAQLLSEDTLNYVAEKMGGAFCVIPSSIHEVIIIPYDETTDLENVRSMIEEVNASEVSPEEVLSDHPYIYRNGELEVA